MFFFISNFIVGCVFILILFLIGYLFILFKVFILLFIYVNVKFFVLIFIGECLVYLVDVKMVCDRM